MIIPNVSIYRAASNVKSTELISIQPNADTESDACRYFSSSQLKQVTPRPTTASNWFNWLAGIRKHFRERSEVDTRSREKPEKHNPLTSDQAATQTR